MSKAETKAPIPEGMIKAASLALYVVDGTLPDYASRELARNEPLRKAMELRATTALESAHVGELVAALENVTTLARIKYGNLDPDVDNYLTETETLVAKIKGE